MNQVYTINATSFFNRPIYLYAFGDIKLKSPVSLRYAGFLLGFILVWTVPLFLMFGISNNVFYLVTLFIPPFVLTNMATKPMFGGKALLEFLTTVMDFFSEPKGFLDGNASKLEQESYTVVNEIWIGRRRELQILADLVEKRAFVSDENTEGVLSPEDIRHSDLLVAA